MKPAARRPARAFHTSRVRRKAAMAVKPLGMDGRNGRGKKKREGREGEGEREREREREAQTMNGVGKGRHQRKQEMSGKDRQHYKYGTVVGVFFYAT